MPIHIFEINYIWKIDFKELFLLDILCKKYASFTLFLPLLFKFENDAVEIQVLLRNFSTLSTNIVKSGYSKNAKVSLYPVVLVYMTQIWGLGKKIFAM